MADAGLYISFVNYRGYHSKVLQNGYFSAPFAHASAVSFCAGGCGASLVPTVVVYSLMPCAGKYRDEEGKKRK
jgi:hypothetical protein